MDIDKLIERMKKASADGSWNTLADYAHKAATALSTIQAENKRLNKIVCSIPTTPDSGRTVSQYDKEMSMCAYLDDLEAETEKLRAELEQVKGERDEAVEYLRGQCRYCKRNLVCISRKGPHSNCWEWRGPQEE